jgi:hypothetical protein
MNVEEEGMGVFGGFRLAQRFEGTAVTALAQSQSRESQRFTEQADVVVAP